MAKKKSSKKRSKSSRTIITALVVILVIILIAALIFISVKGLWKDIIDFIYSLNTSPRDDDEEIPSGISQMQGDVLEMRVLDIGQGDCILLLFLTVK